MGLRIDGQAHALSGTGLAATMLAAIDVAG